MKKITLLLMMLLSISAFSQVEIVENFDSTPDWTVPTGWTTSGTTIFNASNFSACDGKSAFTNFESWQLPGETIITTPNYPAITNATDLTVSFTLNVFESGPGWQWPQTYNAPLASWGSVTLEYSIDGGANWITGTTINDSNLTYVNETTCVTIPAANLGALASGNDFQARFVANADTITDGNILYFIVDNISITQVATSVPNCDVPLLSPTDGSDTTDLNDTITWQAATGIPTGYTVSIGTSSGGTDILNAAVTANTSYSLSGLGLIYGTEYFVNIVANNSFGDATGCTEQSFTTRLAPIEGATCSNPFEITTFPYLGLADDTANYENNINEGPCGNWPGQNIDGYDMFYEITPITDISINIDLAQISANGAAIHIMEGCPDSATTCVAMLGDDWSVAPPYSMTLENVVLSAGTTYFIVLSSGGFDSTFAFDLLLITKNSCINPEFTLAPIGDCGTGEFNIDVDVTYLGDATSLTLSDNFGNSDGSISSTGITNMGPYASGTTVELTLTNNDEGSCFYTDSTFFYCPPSNEDCADSIVLGVNTDDTCTIYTSATNAGATESGNNPISCDFTNTNDVWFSFEATNEIIIVEYLNVVEAIGVGGTIQSTEILEGNCGSFTSLGCFTNTNYVTLVDLIIGNTYYLRNMSSLSGDYAQNYDICLKEPAAAPANDECFNAITLTVSTDETCNNLVSGTTVGATSTVDTCDNEYSPNWGDVWYEFTAPATGLFEFSYNRPDGGYSPQSAYLIYSGTCGALVQESPFCGNTQNEVYSMNSGESLYIMVYSGQNGPGISFELCVYQLPPPAENNDCSSPTELLASTDANGDNAISGGFVNSYPSPEACDTYANSIWYSYTATATGMHTFNLTATVGFPVYTVFNTDDCSNTAGNLLPTTTNTETCWNYGGDIVGDLVAGNTYLIQVFTYDFSQSEQFELLVYPDTALSVETNNFETFKYYPNPVVNTLTVEAKNTISNISIYNIIGQHVQTLEPNNINSVLDMSELKDGVYFVTITIAESQKTIKIVKK